MKLIINNLKKCDKLYVTYINNGDIKFIEYTIENINSYKKEGSTQIEYSIDALYDGKLIKLLVNYIGCGYFNSVIDGQWGEGSVFDSRQSWAKYTMEAITNIKREISKELTLNREQKRVLEESNNIITKIYYDGSRFFEDV